MKYKLKPEYNGSRITIKHPTVGDITFDDNVNNISEYPFFYENGFSHLFEVIKPKAYRGVKNKKKNDETND